ncbi:MAG TPA: rhodanese-like domain-containing protein [Mycobacterium sp.]|jgi:rhodanese-related sulfurtransferase|nr:rhodanese-like domain-containing protein [Mycobacterium sp.]
MPGHQPGVAGELARSREGMTRLTPEQPRDAVADGVLLIDTRTERQRREQGELTGAIVIDRTILEWRLDPSSPTRIEEVTRADVQIIVVCAQGFSSSLAAASLRRIGLPHATDMIGGFEAWRAAGLPVGTAPGDVRT